MTSVRFGLCALLGIAALSFTSCFAQRTSALDPGMTPQQAVTAMGRPDLTDTVPDPNNNGASLLRYTWLGAGESAVFGPDNRLASVEHIDAQSTARTDAQAQAQNQPVSSFDPIQTPLDYTFYPFKAAIIYLEAGLNCIAGSGCHRPHLPPPTQG